MLCRVFRTLRFTYEEVLQFFLAAPTQLGHLFIEAVIDLGISYAVRLLWHCGLAGSTGIYIRSAQTPRVGENLGLRTCMLRNLTHSGPVALHQNVPTKGCM